MTISIKNAYTFALSTFKKRWKLFLALCTILLATSLLSQVGVTLGGFIHNNLLRFVFIILFFVVYLALTMVFNSGVKQILISLVHGRIARFQDVIAPVSDAWKYFLGQLIVLAVGIGSLSFFVLLVGIIASPFSTSPIMSAKVAVVALIVFFILFLWALARFGFWAYALFDKKVSVIKGFTHSKHITRGHTLRLIGLMILYAVLAGFIVILVSLVPVKLIATLLLLIVAYVLVSFYFLLSVHIYHQLDGAHKSHTAHNVVVRPEEIEAHTEKKD